MSLLIGHAFWSGSRHSIANVIVYPSGSLTREKAKGLPLGFRPLAPFCNSFLGKPCMAMGKHGNVVMNPLQRPGRNLTSLLQCSRCLVVSTYNASVTTRPSRMLVTQPLDIRLYQVRWMSRKNFFTDFIENIKQDMAKNKEMKESLKKFREEADKLEQSDALKKARQKYESIEAETAKGSDAIKQRLAVIQDKLKETLDEAEKTELAKKSKELMDELGRTAQKTAEAVSKHGEQLGKTAVFRTVSYGVKSVKEELDETAFRGKLYKAPETLRKREDLTFKEGAEKVVEPDTESTGMVMHKDSRWYQSWENFKDNNQFVHKMFDMKARYDESDNMFVRATRTFTDKVGDLFGGVFSKTEMSEVLTEIVKMDPDFDKERFIHECQHELIPNILEALVRGELDILKDWCYEAPYNMLAQPIQQAREAGYRLDSRVLDINHVDIVAGKIMEQGPMLVLSFNAQQIMVVRDSKGAVIEGDPDKIMKVMHVWAFCRDQTILDPKAAWRIIDLSSTPAEQWL